MQERGGEVGEMSDILCRCGHSIDHHSTHGCLARNGEKLNIKCMCQLAPHHIATSKLAAKDAALTAARTAMELALRELRSTQFNWQEDCLFNANDILDAALAAAAPSGEAKP